MDVTLLSVIILALAAICIVKTMETRRLHRHSKAISAKYDEIVTHLQNQRDKLLDVCNSWQNTNAANEKTIHELQDQCREWGKIQETNLKTINGQLRRNSQLE